MFIFFKTFFLPTLPFDTRTINTIMYRDAKRKNDKLYIPFLHLTSRYYIIHIYNDFFRLTQ